MWLPYDMGHLSSLGDCPSKYIKSGYQQPKSNKWRLGSHRQQNWNRIVKARRLKSKLAKQNRKLNRRK